MNIEFGLKELNDMTLKATYSIEVAGRIFQPGEVIARFDKIQIANFKEIVSRVSANGGFDNRDLIIWENPEKIMIDFNQGIFSASQFALLCNSKLVKKKQGTCTLVPSHFVGESNEDGQILVGKKFIQDVFVYNADTYEKIQPISIDENEGIIVIEQKYCNVLVDFYFCYQESGDFCYIGRNLISGYLLLEGKSRVKDDITGKTRTAIIRVPRLKLISDLNMSLGRDTTPVVAKFQAVGLPIGAKGDKKIMEMIFLDDDIDADM